MKPEEARNVAVFIDIENFLISAFEDGVKDVNLSPVLDELRQHGRITFSKAYGSIANICERHKISPMKISMMMQSNNVWHENIPYLGQKNVADMRLIVEALSLAFYNKDIDCIAIISGDRDYLPLAQKLREINKVAIGCAYDRENVNPSYVDAFDRFFYYSTLLMPPERLNIPHEEMPVGMENVVGSAARPSTDGSLSPIPDQSAAVGQRGKSIHMSVIASEAMDDYVALLLRCILEIEERGEMPLMAKLGLAMRRRKPDFDPRMAGVSHLRGIVNYSEAKGYSSAVASAYDTVVRLTEAGRNKIQQADKAASVPGTAQDEARQAIPAAAVREGAAVDENVLVKAYLKFFEQKLRTPFPKKQMREKAYGYAFDIIDHTDSVSLNDLSMQIANKISQDINEAQNIKPIVFKVLYALYRARFLVTDINELHSYDPGILGYDGNPDVKNWDRHFIMNSIRVLSIERPELPLEPADLARFFESGKDEIEEILREIKARQP